MRYFSYMYVYLQIFKNGNECNIAIISVNDQAWLSSKHGFSYGTRRS